MKFRIVLLLVAFSFCQAYGQRANLLLKINVLKGERYVTKKVNMNPMLSIFSEGLKAKGYTVFTNPKELLRADTSKEDLFFADVFIYQFPASYPTISIVMRNNDGFLFQGEEFIVNFIDRQIANEKIAKTLAGRVPSFDELKLCNAKLLYLIVPFLEEREPFSPRQRSPMVIPFKRQ
ncbi:MAG: methyltransferase-like protein [Polaribacter sp.]|jgi:methyltransferase-like protein